MCLYNFKTLKLSKSLNNNNFCLTLYFKYTDSVEKKKLQIVHLTKDIISPEKSELTHDQRIEVHFQEKLSLVGIYDFSEIFFIWSLRPISLLETDTD